MKIKRYSEFINETFQYVDDYVFDKSSLDNLIKNARKYNKKDFIEEYIEYNDIRTDKVYEKGIKQGDIVNICRQVRDDKGNKIIGKFSSYKTVKSQDDYSSTNIWKFILDNTKELQEEASILYDENKNNKKPSFMKTDKIIKGYHMSPHKFNKFKSGIHNTTGQAYSEYAGFFFFNNIKKAIYAAKCLYDDKHEIYIYECDIKANKIVYFDGETLGHGAIRLGEFGNLYDEVAYVKDADTGFGIEDEIVVFDDDNIKITNIIKYSDIKNNI